MEGTAIPLQGTKGHRPSSPSSSDRHANSRGNHGPDPSDGHKSILHAIRALQTQIGSLGKNSDGYGYKYLSLSKIMQHFGPLFEQYQILVTHDQDISDGNIAVVTELFHLPSETAKSVSFVCPISTASMSMPQWIGSHETYGRRYNLIKLLNLSVEDDDARDPGQDHDEVIQNIRLAKDIKALKVICDALETSVRKSKSVDFEVSKRYQEVSNGAGN